jgi:potassium-transporting ATPase KdpC subunit
VHSVWKTSIRYTIIVTVLFGVAYPLVVTGIAKVLFPRQAAGSLILRDGRVIGSELLAQSFTSDRYFHPRPSATAYSDSADFKSDSTTSPSGGSNLAQSNKALVTRIQGDIDKLEKENPGRPVPIDMVTQSGSGLDPDITPDAAYYQAARVAKARGLTEDRVRELIAQHITPRQLGVLGEPRVNVLELNLALDAVGK